jgi:arylsulfatase A-like enzyme
MSPYDYGLRIPLIFSGPGIKPGAVSDALVAEIDLMPTLLAFVGVQCPPVAGASLKPLLTGDNSKAVHDYVVGEVDNDAQRGVNGMQELAIYDGRYRLIYRERTGKPRQFNADLSDKTPWGNRIYEETIAQKEKFPAQYELLRQLHPQKLGGKPPALELYDVQHDPWELKNLAADSAQRENLERLRQALVKWVQEIGDKHVSVSEIQSAQP